MTEELGMDEMMAQSVEAKPGSIVEGVIVSREKDLLLIDVGLKQEATLSVNEFGSALPAIGSTLTVIVTKTRGPEGRPMASWKQARELKNWDVVFKNFEEKKPIDGKIVKSVKGGVIVDIGLDAFMPASLIDWRPVTKFDAWIGTSVQVIILEMDKAKGNILVSRKKNLEEEKNIKKADTLKTIEVGQVIKGKVSGLTSFGAFIDIGGLEGLLHVSDFSWQKGESLNKSLKVGGELEVKVLKFDSETGKVSLGRKQLLPHPWEGIESRFPVGTTISGKVSGFASFGAFVEVAPGIEGLVHLTEMSWTNKVHSPKEIVKSGQKVEVQVVSIDREKEKLSLSLKRLGDNPWDTFKKEHPVRSQLDVEISHLAPFGAFAKVAEGIDALIRVQDMSWTERVESPDKILKVGDKVKTIILDIDTKNEKISLGIKQLNADPMSQIKVGKSVEGEITSIGEFGINVKVNGGIDGFVPKNEVQDKKSLFKDERIAGPTEADLKNQFKVGDKITASVIKINTKGRKLDLSIRRYDRQQEKVLLKKYSENKSRPTLGDATGWND